MVDEMTRHVKLTGSTMFGGTSINCTLINPETVICNGTTYKEPEAPLDIHDKMFWIYIIVSCVLILFAGLMSGLTMGLLSLDLLNLRVLAEGGKPHERQYAKRLTPVVRRHHFLMVTLLLANSAAAETIPVFLDQVTAPFITIAISVVAVFVFGDLVKCLLFIFYPIAWPISKFLDCILGEGHGTFFGRAELGALVSIHRERQDPNKEPLTEDEVLIIQGALSMRDKVARDACVPLESMYMLDSQSKMDADGMQEVFVKGYSRLPVYEGHRGNILGILLVKTLVQVDPNSAPTVGEIFQEHGRTLPMVPQDMPLYDLLNEMQTGKCHMAAILSSTDAEVQRSQPQESTDQVDGLVGKEGEILGIITLEDIIEELLQEEIVDETDEFVDVHRRVRVARAKLARGQSVQQDTGHAEPGKNQCQTSSSSQSSVKSPRMGREPVFLSRKATQAKIRQGSTQNAGPSREDPSPTVSVNVICEEKQSSETTPLISLE